MWCSLLLVLAPLLAGAADVERHRFDIAAAEAAVALRQFGRQSGESVLFPASVVRGVRTNAVRGELSPADALAQLLAGTVLEPVHDVGKSVWSVRRRAPATPPTPARDSAPRAPAADEPPVEMLPLVVDQRRDAGLITQTIFRTDAAAPVYHEVITRRQIEQLGVTSVAELMTTISGYSGEGLENLQGAVDFSLDSLGATIETGAFLKMRGFDSSRTAVLVNGRRLPSDLEARGPDLSRLSLAAIERVEVLPFSGSAIYGAGVIGGAVNIVLRKDYVGRTLATSFGTSTRGGGTELSAIVIDGFATASGRTRGTITMDYQQRDAVRAGQRPFLARALERRPVQDYLQKMQGASASSSNARSVSNYLASVLPGSPTISSVKIVNATSPGPNSFFVRQYTLRPGAGAPLGAESFVVVKDLSSIERRASRTILRRPTESGGLTAQIEHVFVPDRLELYAEVAASRARDVFSSPHFVAPYVPSGFSAKNPFRFFTSPVMAATTYFDPVDLPDNAHEQTRRGLRAVLGLRGSIGRSWRWTIDGSWDSTKTDNTIDSANIPLNNLMSSGRTTIVDDVFFALYNPFLDHREHPIDGAAVERYFRHRTFASSQSRLYSANARLFGPTLPLPAGPVEISWRTEFQRASAIFRSHVDFSTEIFQMTNTLPAALARYAPRAREERATDLATGVEMIVPVFGPEWRPAYVHGAEFNFAVRSARLPDHDVATTTLAAAKIEFNRSLALRASVSEGYGPQTEIALNGGFAAPSSVPAVRDPLRGGTQNASWELVQSGNPALRPETSTARVLGIFVEPGFLRGVTIQIDAWEMTARDGIRILRPQEIVDRPELAAQFVTRTEPTPADVALGRRGSISRIETRPMNIATTRSAGLDATVSYSTRPGRFGEWTFVAQGNIVSRYTEHLRGFPAVDRRELVSNETRSFGAPAPLLPFRGRATGAWARGGWRAVLGATYTSDHTAQTISRSEIVQDVSFNDEIDTSHVSSSTLWDAQLTYAFPRERRAAALGSLLTGTTWTFGVRNLFDRAPPYRGDGISFYSRFDDPRMRFVYLRIRRSW